MGSANSKSDDNVNKPNQASQPKNDVDNHRITVKPL